MKIVDNAAMFVAMEKGFFKAEASNWRPCDGRRRGDCPGVTSGDLQFGWTNVISLYQAHVEGFDLNSSPAARPTCAAATKPMRSSSARIRRSKSPRILKGKPSRSIRSTISFI